MGLRICKIVIIFGIVLSGLRLNSSRNQVIKTESFNFNRSLGFSAMADKQEEEKPAPVVEEPPVVKKEKKETTQGNFRSGQLTGYAADCPLCNGTLACKPSYNVYQNNVLTYPDATYGDVRIVASSKKLACGSIIKFNASDISSSPIYAIVLDRGVLGNDIDLLMPTEKDASIYIGRRNFTYEIVRTGW